MIGQRAPLICITKDMGNKMIKELIKLANHLDSKGFAKEADYLDGIIKESNRKTKHWIYWEEDEDTPMFPVTAFELGLQKYDETHIPFLVKKIDKAISLEIDNLFVDAIHKAEHIRSNNIDMIKTMNSLRRKVVDELDLFTTEQSQIDTAAKKVVSADRDLNPNSLKNQNKRSLERAKR